MSTCGASNCPICYPSPSKKAIDPQPVKEVVRFDEQLQLVGANNQPACNLFYILTLANGRRHSGFTDAKGRTERITSAHPVAVESIMLQPPGAAWGRECCGGTMANEKLVLKLDGDNIATNDTNVGSSVAIYKLPEGEKRRMTEGEIAMARSVFADAIDYSKVWIHHNGWWLFLGLQRQDTAVTPNGEMYFPKAIYMNDYSTDEHQDRGKALFMHEMTHVWQFQMGYWVKLNALRTTIRGASAYMYSLTLESHMRDFNMEQQGNIVSDYYMLCVCENSESAFNPGKSQELLRKVMEPFLANPTDKNYLPR